MSYRLINANNITFNSDGFITAENIEKMPCIYADLPNGMDGEHYVLEQQSILDKIRDEIENHCGLIKDNHCKYCSYCNSVMGVREILEIIDNYRESEEI